MARSKHTSTHGRAPEKKRGSILIIVLWIILAISILVVGLTYEARSDVERTILLRDRVQAYWYARAAVERVKFDYAVARLNEGPDFETQSRYRIDFPNGFAEALLESNSSKLSINSTDRKVWKQLLSFYGLSDQEQDEAIDALFDWRDADDMERLNGAEDAYYQSLDPPYSPRNGAFFSIEEIMLVRGFTEEMFYGFQREGQEIPGLQEILSISGPVVNRFDLNSAPKAILMAFLEVDEQAAQEIIEAREQEQFKTINDAINVLPIDSGGKLTDFFLTYRGGQFSIKATGFVYNSPARYTVEDEVRWAGGSRFFMNLSHVDYSLDHVDESPVEEEDEE